MLPSELPPRTCRALDAAFRYAPSSAGGYSARMLSQKGTAAAASPANRAPRALKKYAAPRCTRVASEKVVWELLEAAERDPILALRLKQSIERNQSR